MAQVDNKLPIKVQGKKEREDAIMSRAKREKVRNITSTANSEVAVEALDSESAESTDNENVESDHDTITPKSKRPRPKNIISPQVAAAPDRTKISNRNAVYALASFSAAVGQTPADLALNRWSIRRSRIKHRDHAMTELKDSFGNEIRDVPLVVHWDGKLLPDISGNHEKVDRLPILVSGRGVERLLNVPKLPNDTGEAMANAVVAAINNWHLVENVKALSFDTTASNSGIRAGAAVLIEQKIDKALLYLACRHHIFEAVLGDVFNSLARPSTGPDILLFKRFKEAWPSMVHDRIADGMSDEKTATIFNNNKVMMTDAAEFAVSCLQKESQPRDDYRKLFELSLIYMGHIPP